MPNVEQQQRDVVVLLRGTDETADLVEQTAHQFPRLTLVLTRAGNLHLFQFEGIAAGVQPACFRK